MFGLPEKIVIFDTEYTTWEGAQERKWAGPGEHRELLQVGAVMVVPGRPWEELQTFDVLVKPVVNPVLSDYAVELLGITQEKLEREGLGTAEALAKFAAFLGDVPCFSNGRDVNILVETCQLQGIAMPFAVEQFTSFSTPLYEALGRHFTFEKKDYPSGRVHQLPGIALPEGLGDVHNALRDVWSLLATVRWLEERGEVVVR